MLGMGWTVLRSRRGRLELVPAPGIRAVFAFLALLSLAMLLWGVLFEGEATLLDARNVVPLLLVVAMLLGALQEDRWVFDRSAGEWRASYGLLLLARRRRWPMADLDHVGVDRFVRGRAVSAARAATDRPGRQEWVRLLAVDRDGMVRVMDSARAHRRPEFVHRGMRIASYCGVRFEEA